MELIWKFIIEEFIMIRKIFMTTKREMCPIYLLVWSYQMEALFEGGTSSEQILAMKQEAEEAQENWLKNYHVNMKNSCTGIHTDEYDITTVL